MCVTGLFIAILLSFLFTVSVFFRNPISFLTETDVESLGQQYSQSQYVLGDASPRKIADNIVYEYAGYAYILGQDPTTINFEHPPLGKYILGLSYWLTGNVFALNLLAYFGSLVLFWNLCRYALELTVHRLLALTFLGLQPIIFGYTNLGMLDLWQLLVTLGLFSWIFRRPHKIWEDIFAGILLGCLASIKYPIPLIPFIATLLLIWYLFLRRPRGVILLGLTGILMYLSTYAVYFFSGKSILDFIRFEWYRYRWWTGERTIPKFLIVSTLFTGRFRGWWGDNVFGESPNWTPLMPITFLGSFFSLRWLRQSPEMVFLFFYSLGLLALYAIGSAAFERYLIQLVPFWLILFAYGLEKIYLRSQNRHK